MDPKMRGVVRVVPYDPEWKRTFRAVEEILLKQAGDLLCAVEHVGSTAVEGMSAKPIVDIDMVTRDMPALIDRLAQIGFQHEGDGGIPGREVFRRSFEDEYPPYHLYACAPECGELLRHIALRECLKGDAALRGAYSRAKEEAAEKFPLDIAGYMAQKDECVKRALEAAVSRGFLKTHYGDTGAVVVRPMEETDYDAALSLWNHTKGMGMRALDDGRDGICRFLRRNPGLCFVAEAPDAGLSGTILCGQDGRRGYIYHTAVRESLRGQGVGRRLALSALAALKAQGIRKAALVAMKANESGNGFWQAMGFTERPDLVYRNLTITDQ